MKVLDDLTRLLRRCCLITGGLVALWVTAPVAVAQPTLSPLAWGADPLHARLTLSNCSDTNFLYIVEQSSDLTHWSQFFTTLAASTNVSFTVPTSVPLCYYRVLGILGPLLAPVFQNAITVRSNLALTGSGVSVDSFDSSAVPGGLWTLPLRRANGNIATTSSVVNALNVGNGAVYGQVITGSGTSQNAVTIASGGSVGNVAWHTNFNTGIEPGYWTNQFEWTNNLSQNFPDIPAPNTNGWFTSLPAPDTNGVVTLNGGAYVVTNAPALLRVTAKTALWVQNSYSLSGVTFPQLPSRLMLFVGTTTGSNVSLTLRGPVNIPGYAFNLQIYGLPSLTSISYSGTDNFLGTIYAPEANANFSGGGTNGGFTGAMVVNSANLIGNMSFHYDERLQMAGPALSNNGLLLGNLY